MALKRMFCVNVVNTDRFMDLPVSTQLLYFHLGMRGDDDGFVGSPKRIAKAVGCGVKDIRLLAEAGLIIPFDSGVVVIADWLLNNTLRNDRYKQSIYTEERKQLCVGQDGRYALMDAGMEPSGSPKRIPKVARRDPQPNLTQPNRTQPNRTQPNPDQPNQTEQNIEKKNATEGRAADTPLADAVFHSYGQYGWVKLTDEQYADLTQELGQTELDRCIAYLDESAQATGNKNRWQDWDLMLRKCHRGNWGKLHAAQDRQEAAPELPGLCLGKQL